MSDTRSLQLLRFADLKTSKVCTSWPQLRRLVDNYGFPSGYMLSPNVRVWDAEAIDNWLDSRRAASGHSQRQVVAA